MGIWQLHALSNTLNYKLMNLSILNVKMLPEGTSTDGSLLSQSHLLSNGHRWQSCGLPHKARNRKPKTGGWTTSLCACHSWHNLWADLCPLIDSWILKRGIQASMNETICFDYLVYINRCCSVCTVDSMCVCVCVCVCACVRACVRACVCVCLFCFLFLIIFCFTRRWHCLLTCTLKLDHFTT